MKRQKTPARDLGVESTCPPEARAPHTHVPRTASISCPARAVSGSPRHVLGAMGGDSRLQKSMAVMAAIKKGKASVAELKDKCNEAIRKGADLNGIAERQRIPVGGVHGRNYMKLMRDDVKESMKETALAKGKGRLLPGFGDLLDEQQKVGVVGFYSTVRVPLFLFFWCFASSSYHPQ